MATENEVGELLYKVDKNGKNEREPYGTVVDPETLTRKQMLAAFRGHYVVMRHNPEEGEEHFDVVTSYSIEWGDYGFA